MNAEHKQAYPPHTSGIKPNGTLLLATSAFLLLTFTYAGMVVV